MKLIDVLSSLKKSKKLSIDTDVIPFLSRIIISKIKEKPALYTPSGKTHKKFDLLPKIVEEGKAGFQEDDGGFDRSNTIDDFSISTQGPLIENIKDSKSTFYLFLDLKYRLFKDVNPKLWHNETWAGS